MCVCVCVCVCVVHIQEDIAELVLYKHWKGSSWLTGMTLPNSLPTRKFVDRDKPSSEYNPIASTL